MGEPLEVSAEALRPYLVEGRGYVQIKDVAGPADTVPVLQGEGAVPVPRLLGLLDDAGYRGPVSLEWERFWQPHVPPLNEALGAAAAVLTAHPPDGLRQCPQGDPLLVSQIAWSRVER